MGILVTAALVACAHAPNSAETTAGFRELSRHEAQLSRAEAERGRLLQGGSCASPLHAATESVCSESEQLCELSHRLHDRDAETRCLRARETCAAAREHIRARCP